MLRIRNRHFLALDAAFLALAAWVAFLARFEGAEFPTGVGRMLVAYVVVAVPLRLLTLWRMGLYARLWRYAGQADLEHLLAACVVGATGRRGRGAAARPTGRAAACSSPAPAPRAR
jgi:FlaA1/EpsC-like NDP-sugar epimerase